MLTCGINVTNKIKQLLKTYSEAKTKEDIESAREFVRTQILTEPDDKNEIWKSLNGSIASLTKLGRLTNSLEDFRSLAMFLDLFFPEKLAYEFLEESTGKGGDPEVSTSDYKNKEAFVLKYFGMNPGALQAFVKMFTNDIINNMFVDKANKRFIYDNNVFNKSIEQYKKKLLEILLDYFETLDPSILDGIALKVLGTKYDRETALASYKTFMRGLLSSGEFDKQVYKETSFFQLLANPYLSGRFKLRADAYKAFVIAKEFDNLIKLYYKKVIEIDHSNPDNPYKANFSNSLDFIWRSEDYYDTVDEVGNLDKAFVEAMPKYIWRRKADLDGGKSNIENLNIRKTNNARIALWRLTCNTAGKMKIDVTGQMSTSTKVDTLSTRVHAIFDSVFGEKYVDDFLKAIDGKTLGNMLAAMNYKSRASMPLSLYVVTLYMDSLELFENAKDDIYSVYKNIFDPTNEDSYFNYSQNGLKAGDTRFDKDYYTFMCLYFSSIETNNVMEYLYDPEDGFLNKTLRESGATKTLRRLERTLEATNNILTPDPPNTTFLQNGNKVWELVMTFGDYQITLTTEKTETGKGFHLINRVTGEEITKNTKMLHDDFLTLFNTLTPLFNHVIPNIGMYSADSPISQLYLGTSDTLMDRLRELTELCANIIYNKKVSLKLRYKTIPQINTSLTEFYKTEGNIPKVQKDCKELLVVSPKMIPAKNNLAMVIDIYTGSSADGTFRDAQNKQINNCALSALATKITQQWSTYKPEQPCGLFSLYSLYRGISFMRDVRSKDGTVKEATKLNSAEFYTLNFLYDFYSTRFNAKEKGEQCYNLLAAVIADKTKLPKAMVSWDSSIKINENQYMTLRDICADPNAHKILKDLIKREIGSYYFKVYTEVKSTYSKLNELITELLHTYTENNDFKRMLLALPPDALQMDHNFVEFNNALQSIGMEGKINYFFHEIVYEYNQRHPNEPIEFTENLYGAVKKVNGKKSWQANPILYDHLMRLGLMNPALVSNFPWTWHTEEDFFSILEDLVVSDLLYHGAELNTKDPNSGTYIPGLAKAREINKEWLGSNDNIAFAKITGGEFDKKISNKHDYTYWNPYKKVLSYLNFCEENNIQVLGKSAKEFKALIKPTSAEFSLKTAVNVISSLYQAALEHNLKFYKQYQEVDKLVAEIVKKGALTKKQSEKVISNREAFLREKGFSEEEIAVKMAEFIKEFDPASIKNINRYAWIEVKEKLKAGKINLTKDEKALIKTNTFLVEVNPEISKHNLVDYLLGQQYILSAVGSHINHPYKKGTTLKAIEAEMFGLQTKRNVSLSATKHAYVTDTPQSVLGKVKVMYLSDVLRSALDINGNFDKEAINVWDGATFVYGPMVHLENYSLGNSAAGDVKKQFIHAVNPKTGTGIIIKTAGFPINNRAIRKSKAYQALDRIMGINAVFQALDITKDYNGNAILYNVIRKNATKNCWEQLVKLEYDDATKTTKATFQRIADNGEAINGLFTEELIEADSQGNYNLYDIKEKIFGGAYSAHIMEENGTRRVTMDEDDSSNINLAKAMNLVGTKLDESGNVVDLPLKKAMIAYAPTVGATKQGAANINNTEEILSNPDYHLITSEVDMHDSGIQLDKEHSADSSEVSLMTQVVNALGARGYTFDEAQDVYEALLAITEFNIEDSLKSFRAEDAKEAKDYEVKAVMSFIAQALQTNKDADLLACLTLHLKEGVYSHYEALNGKIPVSHSEILNKVITSISTLLTKSAVRSKFSGNLAVMNPSDGLFRLYNGVLPTDVNETIKNLRVKKGDAINLSDIRFDRNYYILDLDTGKNVTFTRNKEGEIVTSFTDKSVLIESTEQYVMLKELLKKGNYSILEDYAAGRELASWGCTFTTKVDINGKSTSVKYNSMDLASVVLQYHIAQHQLTAAEQKYLADVTNLGMDDKGNYPRAWLVRAKLDLLNDLSNLRGAGLVTVGLRQLSADGTTVTGTSQVKVFDVTEFPPELIAPRVYQEEFGLKIGDNLLDITSADFFEKRMRERLVLPNTSQYDLALTNVSGKHTLVLFDDGTTENLAGLTKKEIQLATDNNGNTYRLKADGSRDYRVPADLQVFTDGENEIWYTKDLATVIDNTRFGLVKFTEKGKSKFMKSQESFDLLASELLKSDKTKAFIGDDPEVESYEGLEEADIKQIARSKFFESLDKREDKMLKRNAKAMYTSFLESLKFVAARIPAQCYSSFMSMKVVGFHDVDTNSTYVSRSLIYLQGSDYDIDAVTLLGSNFKGGRYVRWSNLMRLDSYDALQVTKLIPMPTGRTLVETDGATNLFSSINKENIAIVDLLGGITECMFKDTNHTFSYNAETNTIILDPKLTLSEVFYATRLLIEYIKDSNSFGKKLTILDLAEHDIENVEFNLQLKESFINEFEKLGVNTKQLKLSKASKVFKYDYAYEFAQYIYHTFDFSGWEAFKEAAKLKAGADYSEATAAKNYLRSLMYSKDADTFKNFYKSLSSVIRTLNKTSAINKGSGDALIDEVIKLINDHNQYLKKNSLRVEAAMNFMADRMYKAALNPANRILADTSVDNAAKRMKAYANGDASRNIEPSPLETKALDYNSWSITGKTSQNELTLGGKDNVGIVATSIKALEAITQYTNNALNYGDANARRRCMMDLNIGGHRIHFVANTHPANLANVTERDIRELLALVDQYEDSFVNLSAFLSLATDNTKDPILPKLNAGSAMIGLYDAGMILGIPFETLANVMLSETGITLANMTKGNILGGRNNKSVDSILKNVGPQLGLSKSAWTVITKLANALGYTKTNDKQEVVPVDLFNVMSVLSGNRARTFLRLFKAVIYGDVEGRFETTPTDLAQRQISYLKKSKTYWKHEKIVSDLETRINKADTPEKLKKKLLHFLDTHKEKYNAIMQSIENYENLEKLLYEHGEAGIANETTEEAINLKSIIKANKELLQEDFAKETLKDKEHLEWRSTLKNNAQIREWIRQFESYLDFKELADNETVLNSEGEEISPIEVIRQLSEVNSELSQLRPLLNLNLGYPTALNEIEQWVINFSNIFAQRPAGEHAVFEKFKEKYGDDKGNISIDLERFVSDATYRSDVINAYDDVKVAFNVFDIAWNVPHFRGYLEGMASLYRHAKTASSNVRTFDEIARKTLNTKQSSTKQLDYLKKLSRFVSHKNNENFFVEHLIEINATDENGVSRPFKLSSLKDRRELKNLMDSKYIPDIISREGATNDFISTLQKNKYSYTVDGNTEYSYTTSVDTMPRNDNPEALLQFQKVTNGLLQLASKRLNLDITISIDLKNQDLTAMDFFFIYNILAYDNQVGSSTMTTLFNNLSAEHKYAFMNMYMDYISEQDSKGKKLESGTHYTMTEAEAYASPEVSIYTINTNQGPYVWVRNPDTHERVLLKYVDKTKKVNTDEDWEEAEALGLDFDEENNDLPEGVEEFEGEYTRKTFAQVIGESTYVMAYYNSLIPDSMVKDKVTDVQISTLEEDATDASGKPTKVSTQTITYTFNGETVVLRADKDKEKFKQYTVGAERTVVDASGNKSRKLNVGIVKQAILQDLNCA